MIVEKSKIDCDVTAAIGYTAKNIELSNSALIEARYHSDYILLQSALSSAVLRVHALIYSSRKVSLKDLLKFAFR